MAVHDADIPRTPACVDDEHVHARTDARANVREASIPEPTSTLSSPRLTLRAGSRSDRAGEQMPTSEIHSDGRARLQRMKSWGAARIDT